MTTLHNATLQSSGSISITGNLNKKLRDAYAILPMEANSNITLQDSQSTNLSGYYYVNWYINEYFIGKGLTSVSQDYRGYNFTKSFQVMYEKEIIPDWYLEYQGNQWE